jgi:hypothetical protein
VRVHITRRGGIAGVVLEAEIETTELGAEASRVEAALTRLVGSEEPSAPSHPHEFEYEISVPARNQRELIREHEMPSDLEPLLAELSRSGRIRRSRRS